MCKARVKSPLWRAGDAASQYIAGSSVLHKSSMESATERKNLEERERDPVPQCDLG